MKNLILASALAIGGVSTYASTPQTIFFHDGIMDIVFQEDFTPISITNLPVAIVDAVVENYGEEKISKAYKNDLGEYKLELIIENNIEIIFKDKNGHWINK